MRFNKRFLLFLFTFYFPWALFAENLKLSQAEVEALAKQTAQAEEKRTPEELVADKIDSEIVQELRLAQQESGELIPLKRARPIPLYSNAKIERFIDMYAGRKRGAFTQAIERSAKYMPMIERIFAEHDLPPNLGYLAVVESNFNPKARSSANAVGMWQFMRYTGRHFDLHNSWWHDDRYDPEKSTIAAAKYLTQLYNQFGDWELALASYNAGGGKVRSTIRRAKRRHRDTDYWSLPLPRETRGYVPSFYAVNILFENLESYDFIPVPAWEEEEIKEPLSVPGGVSLSQVAKLIQVDPKTLASLNPHIPRGLTPANMDQFDIFIPPGTKYDPASLKALEKNRKRFWKFHRVRNGDTLWAISRRYGVPLNELLGFNNLRKRSTLRIGQKILLPVAEDYNYAAHKRKGFRKRAGYHYHQVKPGDTLWSISQRYRVPLTAVKRWNRRLARKRHLKVGSLVALKISKKKQHPL